MKKIYCLLFLTLFFSAKKAFAQEVLNPNDPIVTYDPDNPPATPPYGSISKWVVTPRLNWNTSSYKSYIYKGMAFRLKFPKNYDPSGNTKYPLVIFLHGLGERGTIYDNELQLLHNGQDFLNAVNNGSYDGFVMFPQSQNGFWGDQYLQPLSELINNFSNNINVDINRVSLTGLSAGGQGDWTFLKEYPKLFAAAEPISAASLAYINDKNIYKYILIWLSQGGQDVNPNPNTTIQVVNAIRGVGGNLTYTVYPDLGHGVWDNHFREPDAFPYFMRANKTNPIVLFGRSEFCQGDNIDITLGITPGFDGYEWRKDGAVIPGVNSNELHVTQLGTYSARIKRGSVWSDWSPNPVVVRIKPPTETPDIKISGLMSKVLPAPDGSTSVKLELPEGYVSYQWRKQGSSQVLDTNRIYTVTDPGNYVARVTELYGCSSDDSQPFKVVNSSGSNAPDAASSLTGFAPSQTQINLHWSDKPNPVNNETGFEIYRSTVSGSSYKLVAINPADSLTYKDNNLNANTTYYYVIRSVNENGAAKLSNEAKVATLVDKIPPTAPANLNIISSSRTSMTLQWDPATDNVGIDKYYIYVNGAISYTTTNTSYTLYNLTPGQLYTFYIIAKDPTGNSSPASNLVSAPAINNGLTYKYYEGSWSKLPDFNALTPVKSGMSPNIDIGLRNQNDHFAFMWTGYINIPVTGNYTFGTNSDDGSDLYIDQTYSASATPLVNNDGAHGPGYKSKTIYLTKGQHSITATYFEATGGQTMELYWSNTPSQVGVTSKKLVPDSLFKDTYTPAGIAPAAPTNIEAASLAYNKIGLTWDDNSNNETGFEIYRSNNINGPYSIINTTASNATSFTDSAQLDPSTTYFYKIQAINKYGASGFSATELGGFAYKYYEGSWSSLPDFNSLTPVKTGNTANVDISPRNQDDHFAFLWKGYINIAVAGDYTFGTNSDDGSDLYVDQPYSDSAKVLVYNDGLHGATYKTGKINLSKGKHLITATYFEATGGQVMELYWQNTPTGVTNKQLIPDSLFANANSRATTLALPPLPSAPTALSLTALSSSKIKLNWTDNSDNEDGFEIYRSTNNNNGYLLLTTINANNNSQASYTDTALFANVHYFYKVRAINVAGNTAYTNEANIKTLDNPPVIEDIPNTSVRYGTTLDLDLYAQDADGDKITFSSVNLPSFASLLDYGDGSGLLEFKPQQADVRSYNGIKIIAKDQNGGADTTTFNLTVGDNYPPVINPITTVNVNEGASVVDTISAADNNGDAIDWTVQGLPAFVNYTTTDTKLILSVKPSFNDAGNYSFIINASDGKGGMDNKSIEIDVANVENSQEWDLNFSYQTTASLPWNNITGQTTNSLKDTKGNNTSVGLTFQTPAKTYYGGAVTGNNSGIYPDNVIKDYEYCGFSGVPNVIPVNITGLDTAKAYDITLFSSSIFNGFADNGHTVFQFGNKKDSIYVQNNKQNTLTFSNIKPNANGVITFNWSKGADAGAGYLNALVINTSNGIAKAPATPTTFTAKNGTGKNIELDWAAGSDDASGFEIFRATSKNGNYLLLNPSPANASAVSYIDTTTEAGKIYYYTMRAVNANGNSPFTDTLSISAVNNGNTDQPPAKPLTFIVKNATGKIVELDWTDGSDNAAGFEIYRSTSKMGNYVLLNPNPNNGNALVYVDSTTVGQSIYYYTMRAVNSKGNSSFTDTVSITTGANSTANTAPQWDLNFSYQTLASSPWNNITGNTISNLKDTKGNTTNLGVALQASAKPYVGGAVTGNNSGIYPDNVIKDYFYCGYYGVADLIPVNITGLDTSKTYNITFFASSIFNQTPDNGHTVFQIGNQKDSIYVQNNKQQTLTFSNIKPGSNGIITFNWSKGSDALAGYLNALVINTNYVSTTPPQMPQDFAVVNDEKGVKLTWKFLEANDVTAFQVYRSTTKNGSFTLLNPSAVNGKDNAYIDSTIYGNTIYYYTMRTVNQQGYSAFTDTLNITTGIKNPVFNPIGDIETNDGKIDTIPITATGDPDDSITFVANNLPSFISLNNTSNGKANIIINPNASDIGNYSNITITANSLKGGSTAQSFNLIVKDKNFSYIDINFTYYGNYIAPAPWNNMVGNATSGMSINNLLNRNNQATSVGISLVDSWTGFNFYGSYSVDDTGIFPNTVMGSSYYVSDTTSKHLKISGLSAGKRYNFVFFGSNYQGNDYTTIYSIGSQSVTLNGRGNISRTVQINGIQADANGNVNISIQKSAAAYAGVINAIVIESYADSGQVISPSDLTAKATGSTKIKLSWHDNSYNETAFNIFRATSANGTYSLIETSPANTTSYTDNGLSSNTAYFYKIQAVKDADTLSDYSDATSAITYQFAVYMNFNYREAAAGAPWNNTNRVPIDGDTFSNLLNDNGNGTGINLKFITNFEGENNVGVVTGNNSGLYPDVVMQGEYYLDNGLDTVRMQLSGLDLSKKYNLVFFGSLVNYGYNSNTYFLVNDKIVNLATPYNSTETAEIDGISPDQNGMINVRMINAPGTAYAILGAMVIQGYTDPNAQNNQRLMAAGLQSYGINTNTNDLVKVYPNPFRTQFSIHLNSKETDGRTGIVLYNISGNIIYQKDLGILSTGSHTIDVDLNGKSLNTGIYILKIKKENKKTVVIKLLKN